MGWRPFERKVTRKVLYFREFHRICSYFRLVRLYNSNRFISGKVEPGTPPPRYTQADRHLPFTIIVTFIRESVRCEASLTWPATEDAIELVVITIKMIQS